MFCSLAQMACNAMRSAAAVASGDGSDGWAAGAAAVRVSMCCPWCTRTLQAAVVGGCCADALLCSAVKSAVSTTLCVRQHLPQVHREGRVQLSPYAISDT